MSRGSPQCRTLVDRILEENPNHTVYLRGSLSGLTDADWIELDHYLSYCLDKRLTIDYLAECYNVIVQDAIIEQIYFMRHKKYRYSTYAEAAERVYDNAEYMEHYMYGLAITLYFWPAHRELKGFFSRTLPLNREGSYLEIGPGHGSYIMQAIKSSSFKRFVGVDISAKSVELTREILQSGHFGSFENYSIEHADFLEADLAEAPFDAAVMGEVIEHVEDPERFVARVREVTRPDAYIFMSTCMNAPIIDHIALFRSVSDVEKVIAGGGLAIADSLLIPYPGLTVKETEEQELTLNIALRLCHPDE